MRTSGAGGFNGFNGNNMDGPGNKINGPVTQTGSNSTVGSFGGSGFGAGGGAGGCWWQSGVALIFTLEVMEKTGSCTSNGDAIAIIFAILHYTLQQLYYCSLHRAIYIYNHY